jgi:predicted phage tail protein
VRLVVRRGYAVTCRRLYGGVWLTVVAAGVFLSVVGAAGIGLRVFSPAPVVAAASAALGCRDWRLALPAAALLALILTASAA